MLFHNVSLQVLDLQSRGQGLLQLLGLGSIVDDQGVLVTSTSDLELGLLEFLAVGVDLLVHLDDSGLDIASSGQLDKLLDVLDFLGHFMCLMRIGDAPMARKFHRNKIQLH